MLYLCFRGVMIFLSVMGLVSMMVTEDYKYVIFPISALIWSLYTFFREEDEEYRRRHGIKSTSWFSYDDYDYYGYDQSYGRDNYSSHNRSSSYSSYTPSRTYSNPAYKKIVKRCKKSVNITIDKLNNKTKKENG